MTTATGTKSATLTLRCQVCKKPVTGTSGYICVYKNAVHDPQLDSDDYWFCVSQVRTERDLFLYRVLNADGWHS